MHLKLGHKSLEIWLAVSSHPPVVVSGGQFLFLILLTGNLQISDSAMTVILASIVWLMVLLKLIILNTVRYCYHLSDVQCGPPF